MQYVRLTSVARQRVHHHRKPASCWWFVCVACLLLCFATVARADRAAVALEHEVKAAMLYKFLGYIEWPASVFPSEQSPYVIAVIGAKDIANELQDITRLRTVNNRPVEVREIEHPQAQTDAHMVFVGRNEESRAQRLLIETRKLPIVTVTENEQGLQEGAVINLRLVDGQMKFDVSLPESDDAQLRFSARMLAIASTVKKGGF